MREIFENNLGKSQKQNDIEIFTEEESKMMHKIAFIEEKLENGEIPEEDKFITEKLLGKMKADLENIRRKREPVGKQILREVSEFYKFFQNMKNIENRDKEIEELSKKIFKKSKEFEEIRNLKIGEEPKGEKEKKIWSYLLEIHSSEDAWVNREQYLERLKKIWEDIKDL